MSDHSYTIQVRLTNVEAANYLYWAALDIQHDRHPDKTIIEIVEEMTPEERHRVVQKELSAKMLGATKGFIEIKAASCLFKYVRKYSDHVHPSRESATHFLKNENFECVPDRHGFPGNQWERGDWIANVSDTGKGTQVEIMFDPADGTV